jgi:hypothetical protein
MDSAKFRSSSAPADPALLFLEPAYQLALSSPLVAVRTLARALRQQTRGAQAGAIRTLISTLVEHDRNLAAAIRKDVAQLKGA